MNTVTTNVKTVKAPSLPRPSDDDEGYDPTASDLSVLGHLFPGPGESYDDVPVPDWVEREPEPCDELEQERALSLAAREQSARHSAWVDAGRPAWPYSDAERAMSRYLIRPELAAWLAYSGGHEMPR